jgi:hypothetical protein
VLGRFLSLFPPCAYRACGRCKCREVLGSEYVRCVGVRYLFLFAICGFDGCVMSVVEFSVGASGVLGFQDVCRVSGSRFSVARPNIPGGCPMRYSEKDIGVQVSYIVRFVLFSCHWERSCYKTYKNLNHAEVSPVCSRLRKREQKIAADGQAADRVGIFEKE